MFFQIWENLIDSHRSCQYKHRVMGILKVTFSWNSLFHIS